jgi:acyl phosphate:glycerol-3-phosphate acyltransferase
VSVASYIIWFLAGYFCGSVPFGLILTRVAGLGDIRKTGSGNIGATNVLRTGNKLVAAQTLLFDALKGFLPVFAALWFGQDNYFLAAAAGAIAGHLYPVWLQFRGGKGVATFIGVIFAFHWLLGIAFLATWIVVALLTRISSASALVASAAAPVFAWFFGHANLIFPLAVLAAVVWYRHASNMKRLLNGEEPRISFSTTK